MPNELTEAQTPTHHGNHYTHERKPHKALTQPLQNAKKASNLRWDPHPSNSKPRNGRTAADGRESPHRSARHRLLLTLGFHGSLDFRV